MPALKNKEDEALAQAFAAVGNGKATAKALGMDSPRGNGASTAVTNTVRNKPEIAARVQELVITKFEKANITAARVMTELARVAFASAKDIFDENGDLIPVHKLSDDAAATIAGIDVEVQMRGRGENAEAVTIKKVRRADKMAALGILAKHFKIVGDEGDGVNALASALADRLNAAKRRLAPRDIEDAEIVEPPPPAPLPPPRMQFPFPEPEKRPRGRPRNPDSPPRKRAAKKSTPAPKEPQPEESDDEQLW